MSDFEPRSTWLKGATWEIPGKEDFVLSIELGGGKTKLVGDDEHIEVHDGERFLAIENDDNS